MNINKRLFGNWFSMISIVLLLVGCGATDGKQKGITDTDNADVKSTDYESMTFDNYGRELVVTKKPTKVLALGPNTTELLIALGLTDYVIGNSLNNHSREPLPEFADDYAKIPELTYGSVTREAVVTSGADFIYGIDWEFGEEGVDIEELKEYGITTYVNSATTIEEMYQEILDLGKIFEIEDVAEAFVADQKARIAAVQEKIAGEEPVKVLVYDSGGDGVFTAGGTNFATELIELAGGKNIFDDITNKQWTTVGFEEVLERQPEIFLIQDYDVPPLDQKIEELKQIPALADLESVKNERFVSNSLETVLPGNRMAYAVETLAKGFYPELFD